ncbi:MAG: aminoacyl-tRNA hydrolase [Peptostreptococcales bacterium]
MYLIVGLGNPGREYQNTRHNAGFMAIDYLADKHHIPINKIKHKGLLGEGMIAGQKVLLLKPQTYMNLSGHSVREALEYYKIDLDKLILVYDDIDIDTGSVRIRKKGSAGTHNGMKSVIYDLQSDEFCRVRIGIGRDKDIKLENYVLSRFKPDETKTMEDAIIKVQKAIEAILEKGIDNAMNEYN